MKQKKNYECPKMVVVELPAHHHLLAGSGGLGAPGHYLPGGDPTEE